jgi:hypothetical protein
MNETENQFLKVAEAKKFINGISDPNEREFLWAAFGTITIEMAPAEVSGQFDVLFFMQVLSRLAADKEGIERLLQSSAD